jgi:hypothetical protein
MFEAGFIEYTPMTTGALPIQHALFRGSDVYGRELLLVCLVDGRCAIIRDGKIESTSDCTSRGIRRLVDRFHNMTQRISGPRSSS